jgi:hypothetical protein
VTALAFLDIPQPRCGALIGATQRLQAQSGRHEMNTVALSLARDPLRTHSPAWGAVFSMALCVAVLIASEFMPVSLLTPIAQDLGMTEGRTGQAISISGIFAVLTSLLTVPLTAMPLSQKVTNADGAPLKHGPTRG